MYEYLWTVSSYLEYTCFFINKNEKIETKIIFFLNRETI